MDLLTIILPLVGGALVWAYNAYTKKTGIDPLANRPLLKLLFEALSKTMPASQQLDLATQLGLHNDPGFMQQLLANAENAVWNKFPATGSNMMAPQPPDPTLPASTSILDDKTVHVPIRLSIHPQFLQPDAPPPPAAGAPAIKLAAA